MLAFYPFILLWGVYTTTFIQNFMFKIKILDGPRSKFSSIVTPDHFYIFHKLISNHNNEMLKMLTCFTSNFHQVCPSHLTSLMNNTTKIMSTTRWRNSIRTPNSTINQIKNIIWIIFGTRELTMSLFCTETFFINIIFILT